MIEKAKSSKKTSPDAASVNAEHPVSGSKKKVAEAATKTTPVVLNAVPVTNKATKTALVKAPKAGKPEKITKDEKPKKVKVKLIRDGFTIPENEYAVFDNLKQICLHAGVHAKKSELLRAALITLSKLSDSEIVNTVSQVEKLKTGRPTKTKQPPV